MSSEPKFHKRSSLSCRKMIIIEFYFYLYSREATVKLCVFKTGKQGISLPDSHPGSAVRIIFSDTFYENSANRNLLIFPQRRIFNLDSIVRVE